MSHFELNALTRSLNEQEGMKHAILQSLLNWSKARANDPIEKDQDHQGWWANEFLSGVGCRDWTLARSKQTNETLRRAKHYTEQALDWLIAQGKATAIEVECEYVGERLNRRITITLPDETTMEVTV